MREDILRVSKYHEDCSLRDHCRQACGGVVNFGIMRGQNCNRILTLSWTSEIIRNQSWIPRRLIIERMNNVKQNMHCIFRRVVRSGFGCIRACNWGSVSAQKWLGVKHYRLLPGPIQHQNTISVLHLSTRSHAVFSCRRQKSSPLGLLLVSRLHETRTVSSVPEDRLLRVSDL